MAKRTTDLPPAPLTSEAQPFVHSKWGTGWKRDNTHPTLGHLVDQPVAKLLGAPLARVKEASLLDCVVTVFDQSTSSSCVGHAISQCCNVRFKKMGLNIEPRSRMAAYTYPRELDAPDADSELLDQGAFPRRAFTGLSKWGFPSEHDWPFDLAQINTRLPFDVKQASAQYKVQDWYAIPGAFDQRLAQIEQSLIAGYPVFFGMDVTQSFFDYTKGVMSAADFNGDDAGGHALCIVAFHYDGSKAIYTICNSYGPGWGMHGFVQVYGDVLLRPSASDFRVVQVGAGNTIDNSKPTGDSQ